MLWLRTWLGSTAHRVIKRRQRSRHQVDADYESGEWAQQEAARNWLATPNPADYADKAWVGRDIVAEMGGRLWTVPAKDYYAYRRGRLIEILQTFGGDARTIVELGSGTGSNLFALSTAGSWDRLIGLELSKTGRRVTQTVAEHFGLADTIAVDFIDLLDPASPGFALVRDSVCFTHYCLEQLTNQTEQVFRNILNAAPRRVVMIEPSFELLDSSLKDAASRAYVLRQDYQRSIVQVASNLEREGAIRVTTIERLDFVSSWRNSPTLVVWEPTHS